MKLLSRFRDALCLRRLVNQSASRKNRISTYVFCTAALLALVVLPACDQIQIQMPQLVFPATPTSKPSATADVLPTVAPTSTTQPQENSADPHTLKIWLPPQFDPNADTPAGRLLKDRLQAFQKLNPAVVLDVRVKAPLGPGGMLESLAAANAAAPGAVPALVALPRSDLETAALKGLVIPYEGLTNVMDDADWYPYARQLAQIQGSTFGLPFGGDALLLAYRPARMGPPPTDWNAIMRLSQPVIFSAADPQATVTLNFYMMLGGVVEDDQRRPTLQPAVLAKAFKLYADGIQPGVFPYFLSQIQTDQQAWQAFSDQRGQWLITWSSLYLSQLPADTTAVAIPSLSEKPLALATGWVWALSDPLPERRLLSVKLAEFLVDRNFLSGWNSALSLLPTRPSVLSTWPNVTLKPVLNQVVLSAQIRPSNDLMSSLGPALEAATLQVIKRETDANQAAQAAAERLTIPKTK